MTKDEKHVIDRIKNPDVKSILCAIQEHDVQLAPIALSTLVNYICRLEEKWKE